MSTLLRLEGVHCSYGPVRALSGVTIDVGEGSIVCLLGANGAGKSTTLKAISGLVRPTAGTVTLGAHEILRLEPAKRVALGITHCPEGRAIFGDLTVAQNLYLGGHLMTTRDVKAAIDRVLEIFPDLAPRLDHAAGTLSGGGQQMLAVARALMPSPRLLLLDEPTLGLAPILARQVIGRLHEIRGGGTAILLVEQNSRLALQVSDHGYVLASGQVVASGKPADLAPALEEYYLGAQVTTA